MKQGIVKRGHDFRKFKGLVFVSMDLDLEQEYDLDGVGGLPERVLSGHIKFWVTKEFDGTSFKALTDYAHKNAMAYDLVPILPGQEYTGTLTLHKKMTLSEWHELRQQQEPKKLEQ